MTMYDGRMIESLIARVEHAEQTIRQRQDALLMADAISQLDPFQDVFNIPAWMPQDQQFDLILHFILAEIVKESS